MALSAAPFGFRPLRGAHAKTIPVVLAADAVAAIGIGDVLLSGDSGATVLRSDTDTEQVGICGVAAEAKAQKAGGIIMCWDVRNGELFEVQSAEVGTTIGTDAAVGHEVYNIIGNKARNETTMRSTQSITTSGADTTNAAIMGHYHAKLPGNDPNVATNYPILVVSFVPITAAANAGKLVSGV